MTLNISKVDSFPEISRSGRVSGELQLIIDALVKSAETGEKFCISDVQKGKPYNSMQQRIRAQAKKLNFNVVIRFDSDTNSLYFKASKVNKLTNTTTNEPTVSANEVASVKSKIKTNK